MLGLILYIFLYQTWNFPILYFLFHHGCVTKWLSWCWCEELGRPVVIVTLDEVRCDGKGNRHKQVYICAVRNSCGHIISKVVFLTCSLWRITSELCWVCVGNVKVTISQKNAVLDTVHHWVSEGNCVCGHDTLALRTFLKSLKIDWFVLTEACSLFYSFIIYFWDFPPSDT